MTPFEHRPDPELGALLRAALDPPRGDHAAFVARVVAAAERRDAPTMDVLARWARVGIAAAVLAAIAAGFAVQRNGAADDALNGTETGAVFASRTPDASMVLASWPER